MDDLRIYSDGSASVSPPLLTRDQRDALCAANAFLAVLQSSVGEDSTTAHRIQKAMNVISDLLYKE